MAAENPAPTLSDVLRATGSELSAQATNLDRNSSDPTSRANLTRAACNAAGVLHMLAVALDGATWTIGDGH